MNAELAALAGNRPANQKRGCARFGKQTRPWSGQWNSTTSKEHVAIFTAAIFTLTYQNERACMGQRWLQGPSQKNIVNTRNFTLC